MISERYETSTGFPLWDLCLGVPSLVPTWDPFRQTIFHFTVAGIHVCMLQLYILPRQLAASTAPATPSLLDGKSGLAALAAAS